MRVFGLQKGFYQLWRLNIKELSPVAKERLRFLRACPGPGHRIDKFVEILLNKSPFQKIKRTGGGAVMVCETIKKGVECIFMKKGGCSYNGGRCYPIVEQCLGCAKVQVFEAGSYCSVFPYPEQKWQSGVCQMATHVKRERKTEEQKINPLKASKRSAGRK